MKSNFPTPSGPALNTPMVYVRDRTAWQIQSNLAGRAAVAFGRRVEYARQGRLGAERRAGAERRHTFLFQEDEGLR